MSKQKSWVKIIALAVCLAVAFAAMPVAAFAEEETTEETTGVATTGESAEETSEPGSESSDPVEASAGEESGSAGESEPATETATETESATETETAAETDPVEAAALRGVPIKPFAAGDLVTFDGITYKILTMPGGDSDNGTVQVGDGGNLAVNDSVTTVDIPAAITITGDNAGTYDVTAIGSYAFSSSYSLESVAIPGRVEMIGDYAFHDCISLESVAIPGSVETIGSNAFRNCTSLESVTISEGVKEIGIYAFSYCGSLGSAAIPGSVETIGGEAFSNCTSLESVTISEGVKEIGFRAFINCGSLESVTIPGGVETIGDNAFSYCDSLGSVTISEGVKEIGAGAFDTCSSLGSVAIPGSVETIGIYAFSNCDSLESVTIPGSVETIGYQAFYGCDNLTEVTFESSSPPAIDAEAFSETAGNANGMVRFPDGAEDEYTDAWLAANFPVNWALEVKEDPGDTTPPTVIRMSPDGPLPVYGEFSVVFSETMNDSLGQIRLWVTWAGDRSGYWLNLDAAKWSTTNLTNDTYTVPYGSLGNGFDYDVQFLNFEDLAGNPALENGTFRTLTAESADGPPRVLSVTPDEDDENVEVSGELVIAFSEKMNENVAPKVSLFDSNSSMAELQGGRWEYGGTEHGGTIFMIPYGPLQYNTEYTVSLEGFQDTTDDDLPPDSSHSFTTMAEPDAPPPTVESVTIAGSSDLNRPAPLSGTITVTFSEEMDPIEGLIALGQGSEVVLLEGGSWDGGFTTYSVDYSSLDYGNGYYVNINSFQNAAKKVMEPIIVRFTTEPAPDTTPPTVVDVTISDVGLDSPAPLYGRINILFSEAMQRSGEVHLKELDGPEVPVFSPDWRGPILYSITYLALKPDTQYEVTLSGFEDLEGNTMAEETFRFQTGPNNHGPSGFGPEVVTDKGDYSDGDIVPFSGEVTISYIITADPNNPCYYTTDGSSPGSASTQLFSRVALIHLTETTTLKAIAIDVASGDYSEITTVTFVEEKDMATPSVVSTTLADGVGVSGKFTITFNVPMNPDRGYAGIAESPGALTGKRMTDEYTFEYSYSGLSYDTKYTVDILYFVSVADKTQTGDFIRFTTGSPPPVDPLPGEPADRPTRPRSSSDDDDGDPAAVKRPRVPSEVWMTAKNLRNPSRESVRFGVRASAWNALTGSYYHDSLRGRTVEVRTYFDDPGLFTADSYVSGWTTGADVDRTRATFGKWFANKVRVIHFDREGMWEHPVRVAAKVDLAGLDMANLVLYAYDPKANAYRRLAAPAYSLDANGYLRFTTEYAGEIIVSEGGLEK